MDSIETRKVKQNNDEMSKKRNRKENKERSKRKKNIGNSTKWRKQAETIRVEEAPACYYRSSIDRSILGAYPSESLCGGISTVKKPTLS